MNSLILMSLLLFGAPEEAKKEVEHKVELPQKEDYENFLKNVENWTENIDNQDFYKDIEFVDQKDPKKTTKFLDLNDFQKQVFYITNTQNALLNLEVTYKMWQLLPKQHPDGPVSSEDLQKYSEKLKEFMKKTANKWEDITKNTFKKFADKFTQEEMNVYLKNLEDTKKRIFDTK